ncbi:MAG: deoxyguanosinetriphosphate triphosphohydrolase, partial [Oscillospiraceae bacterium]|nr:deoxyguanosinetriphosphate triphosphohydrolase [Oscillospiraceae bacterium]
RVVDRIERDGQGLNLCYETRMGILNHTHGAPDDTLEATIVRYSDRIAYINHDLDDAIRADIIGPEDVPADIRATLGDKNSGRINAIVTDLIEHSAEGKIQMSPEMEAIYQKFHNFMYEAVYYNQKAKGEESKVKGIISGIYDYYIKNPDRLPGDYKKIAETDGLGRAVCDYVAGMTDGYAMEVYSNIFIPMSWTVK